MPPKQRHSRAQPSAEPSFDPDAMDVLATAAMANIPPEKPIITAMYTFKGGGGKTTLAVWLATVLALAGFIVLVIDGDQQCNATTFWGENPVEPENDEALESGDEDDEGETNGEGSDAPTDFAAQIQRAHKQRIKDILLQQGTTECLELSVAGDELQDDVEGLASSYLTGKKEGDAEKGLYEALAAYVTGQDFDIELQQVQKAKYDGQDGKGRIWLLRGTDRILEFQSNFSTTEGNKASIQQAFGAFHRMTLDAAKKVSAHFVFIDMGPTSDSVNRMMATSADFIQPIVNPDMFSWSAAIQMLTDVLPKWLKWKAEMFDKKFFHTMHMPSIMPFVMNKHVMQQKKKKTVVSFSDSAWVHAMVRSLNELAVIAKNDEQEVAQLDIKIRERWQEHLKKYGVEDEGSKLALKTVVWDSFMKHVKTPVVPLMRHLKYMPMCHELGVAYFDIDQEGVKNFYFNVGYEMKKADKDMIRKVCIHINKEALVILQRLQGVSDCYIKVYARQNPESSALLAVAAAAAASEVERRTPMATATPGTAHAKRSAATNNDRAASPHNEQPKLRDSSGTPAVAGPSNPRPTRQQDDTNSVKGKKRSVPTAQQPTQSKRSKTKAK